MADALDQLKERLTETQDLGKIARILSWDQQVMMPRAGTQHRAEQFGALVKVAFEKFTDPPIGKLLDELAPLEDSLDPDSDDHATIRLTRRDYEKAVKVPGPLRPDYARASSEANPAWVHATA